MSRGLGKVETKVCRTVGVEFLEFLMNFNEVFSVKSVKKLIPKHNTTPGQQKLISNLFKEVS